MIVSVVFFFLVFSFVLAWLFFKVKGMMWMKIAMVALLFYSSSMVVLSFDSYMGWPAKDRLAPDTMILTSVLVFVKTPKTEGKIFVTGIPCITSKTTEECMLAVKNDSWLATMDFLHVFGYAPGTLNTPRIFEFPYSEQNRKMFGEAQENLRNGGQSVLRKGMKPGEGNGESGEGGGPGDVAGAENGPSGGQGGEGTENADSKDSLNIWIDNLSIQNLMRKDEP